LVIPIKGGEDRGQKVSPYTHQNKKGVLGGEGRRKEKNRSVNGKLLNSMGESHFGGRKGEIQSTIRKFYSEEKETAGKSRGVNRICSSKRASKRLEKGREDGVPFRPADKAEGGVRKKKSQRDGLS